MAGRKKKQTTRPLADNDVIEAMYKDGFSQGTIAKKLMIPRSTVGSVLRDVDATEKLIADFDAKKAKLNSFVRFKGLDSISRSIDVCSDLIEKHRSGERELKPIEISNILTSLTRAVEKIGYQEKKLSDSVNLWVQITQSGDKDRKELYAEKPTKE